MDMERFSIDESGYTGFDLLNAQQPFQGASAICISDEDARRLINTHFPKHQGPELKYSSLKKRPGNLPRLLGLQEELLKSYKCVTYVCDKRFLLILMFVDDAVEPFYYARGVNFYEDGNNYTLASLLYYTGSTVWGDDFDALLAEFQSAVKIKTFEEVQKLFLRVRGMDWNQLPEALGPLALGCPDCVRAILSEGVTTDAAFIVLQSLISRMEVMATGVYSVDHDRSKNLDQYHAILKRFINHTDVIEFRQSEIAGIKFPLKLRSVVQVDSKTSPSVQLADVVVGSAMDMANGFAGKQPTSEHFNKVLQCYGHDQIIHMLPSLDFEAQKHFRKGTQAYQVIDYFSRHFSGNDN